MRGLTAAERALLERIRAAADANGEVTIPPSEKEALHALLEQWRVTISSDREIKDGVAWHDGGITSSGLEALRVHAELVRVGLEAA